MAAKPDPLDQLLRASAAVGAPVELILDSWSEVEDALLADAGAARAALTAASDALPSLAGAIAERRALATAVMTARGDVAFADAAFRDLMNDTHDLRPLLRRALREGPVVGLVEGAAGAAFTAWVGGAAAAARWPLEPAAVDALAGRERLAVVVSAPSRSSELARVAARTLDLTALEARLAEALLFAPNLDVAAAEVGVGRETARDALRRLNAKAGVRRTPELVSRLVEIMCATQGAPARGAEVAEGAFGLTPAEARVAALIARGATNPEAAEALSLSPETVKTHLKIVFGKTGARRAKDLARLLAEAGELVALADAADPVFGEEDGGGRLRVVFSLDGARRIALIDYGPRGGEPVIVFHGAAAGRRLPGPFREALRGAGLRPIVVQRPGFGLTDPATGSHPVAGADDMAAVIERLRLRKILILGRDTGVPVAFEFARRYPELLTRGVLLNPQPPLVNAGDHPSFTASVQRRLLRNPELVGPFAEFLRRQATTPLVQRVVRKTLAEVSPDKRALEDPAVLDFLVRDIQALCARSIRGFAAEHALYASGWRPPTDITAGPWTIAISRELPGRVDPDWMRLPDRRLVWIDGAGLLPQFTHPEALTRLVRPV